MDCEFHTIYVLASTDCVETCAERLEEIMRGEVQLVLGDNWQILSEYTQNLHFTGNALAIGFSGGY